MKNIYLYLLTIITVSACQSSIDSSSLENMLLNQNESKEKSIQIIENACSSIESSALEVSLKNEIRAGITYDYKIYRSNGLPVKISYDIRGDSYTVQASYYIHDTIPYFIHGTMRDQDRASGKYSHQELFTYLDGKKVIKQLKKSAINEENRASDLSDIESVDVTKYIKQPDLDASMKYEEVKNILKIM